MSEHGVFEQPFPGLRPYDMHDAPLFFGRHTHVAEMISLLERQRFMAVVGASGSGKSSLVRAGLLPAIRDGFVAVDSDPSDDAWCIVICRPGDDPYRALAESLVDRVLGESLNATAQRERVSQAEAALRASQYGLTNALRLLAVPPSHHVVVLVDQFEELFRFRRDEATRIRAGIVDEATLCERRNDANAFVNMLLKSCQQTEQFEFVIITMRSDFLGDCDAFIGLPEAISRSQYLTPRLTRSQLEDAIRRPLALPQFKSTIADELVTRILNDVGSEPDQLPLMQHALMRTWQQHRAAADGAAGLKMKDYTAVGGVSGALDQHADEVFHRLGDDQTRARLQHVAERLFCSLSERREGGPLTRRPITVAQAALEADAQAADVESVAQAFRAAHLLVFSPAGQPLGPETRLDISHESLLRQWGRLRGWIETESKSALSYRRLIDAVRSGDKELSDAHLAQAEEWWKLAQPNVHWAMRYDGAIAPANSLFQACLALIESSREARQTRWDKEKAGAERLENYAKAATFACVLAIIFLVLAVKNLYDARSATKRAGREEYKAEKLQATVSRDNESHLWRFATAARDAATPDTIRASRLFLCGAEALSEIVPDKRTPADGRGIARNGLAAWAIDRSLLRTWVHDGPVQGAHLSQDESRVLTWSDDGTARLWDVTNPAPIQSFKHDGQVRGAQFSQDESRVLTWSRDGGARLWDVNNSEPIQIFKHAYAMDGAQFSHDGSRVLTWGGDGRGRLWDVNNPEPIRTFQNSVRGAQFSQDESRVLTWSSDGCLWDVTKPEPIQTFQHNNSVLGARFSQDESQIGRASCRERV